MTPRRIHVAGVAGIGMSALAELLRARGCTVSGSDRFLDQRKSMPILDKLARCGVQLTPQDGSGLAPGVDALAVSTAIEADNPDVQAAKRLGIPVRHRARMIAEMLDGMTCLAVAGTCGKTTVTGMLGWLLEQLGQDPTVVNGGVILNWTAPDRIGSIRRGHSQLAVVETDESDKSLLRFHPDWAIITNISKDHFELNESIQLFRTFARQVKQGILCGPGVRKLLTGAPALPRLFDMDYAPDPDGRGFTVAGRHCQAPCPGRHNMENAALAVSLCLHLGANPTDTAGALAAFKGIQRRLEIVGRRNGVTVVDDYAHNPAKIRAAWQTMAAYHPRVLGVWRPHGFRPLTLMHRELGAMFNQVMRPEDQLYILPVFYAGGTTQCSITADVFVEDLCKKGMPAQLVKDYENLSGILRQQTRPDDVILCMGARDPDLPLFARSMAR